MPHILEQHRAGIRHNRATGQKMNWTRNRASQTLSRGLSDRNQTTGPNTGCLSRTPSHLEILIHELRVASLLISEWPKVPYDYFIDQNSEMKAL